MGRKVFGLDQNLCMPQTLPRRWLENRPGGRTSMPQRSALCTFPRLARVVDASQTSCFASEVGSIENVLFSVLYRFYEFKATDVSRTWRPCSVRASIICSTSNCTGLCHFVHSEVLSRWLLWLLYIAGSLHRLSVYALSLQTVFFTHRRLVFTGESVRTVVSVESMEICTVQSNTSERYADRAQTMIHASANFDRPAL